MIIKLIKVLIFNTIIFSFLGGCRNGLTDDGNSTADGVEPNSTVNLRFDSEFIAAGNPFSSPALRWDIRSSDFIDHYEVSLGYSPGSTDIVGWERTDNLDSHIFDNLSIPECTRVYATLRSVDITNYPIQVLNDDTGLVRDNSPPPFGTEIDVTADDAIFNEGPLTTWIPTSDNCSGTAGIHYEYAIGTTPGASNVVDFFDIGTVNSYRVQAGVDNISASLSFQVGIQYHSTVRVYDESGLYSEQRHPTFGPWYYGFNPRDLPNMVAWLDGADRSTVIDENSRDANNGAFTGNVDQWRDISGSANVHNFSDIFARPTYNIPLNAVQYSGSECLAPSNHADLNLATVNQRNLTVIFETSGNTASRQVIYEEGGNVRGMNIFIANNNLYCGFYNLPDDGDGTQPFVSVNRAILPNTKYVVTWVFDYTNYAGAGAPDGTLKCYANGAQIGATLPSTSRLYAHSGAIGLGCKNNTTFYETGVSAGNGDYFQGRILELMLFNDPPTPATITNIHQFSAGKWGF